MSDIAKAMRMKLAESGLKRTELAKRAGVPISSVTNIANGKTANPAFTTINKLAKGFGCKTSELVQWGE